MRADCAICDGTGRGEVEVWGAAYYRGDELEPRYESCECSECGGIGEVTVCPVCRHTEDACPCTEDDFVDLGRTDYATVFAS